MIARKAKTPPTTPGHKCAGAKIYVSVGCECGWTSGKWHAGLGGRGSAYAEWRWHVDNCTKENKAAQS